MSMVYDNWERLVAAVLKREQLRQIAMCPSFSSSSSSSFSSDFRFDPSDSSTVANNAPGGVTGGVASRLFATPSSALAWFRRRKPKDHFSEFPAGFHLAHLQTFSLLELQVASDNFSQKNILGRDVYGKLYKGRLADGSLVQIKRLNNKELANLFIQTEVEISGIAVHPNLLSLRGFCMTLTERLLVYPYMANGNVASCLRERPASEAPLDWRIRKRIALGSARGLAYLHDHCDPKIIHRDVKAANIFLDEDFEAIVGVFGLAKLMHREDTHVYTTLCGTTGLIAPEYISTGRCSDKSDVYGYGVMLLELITGKRAFDLVRLANDDDVMLFDGVRRLLKEKKWETLVDADLGGNHVEEEVVELIQLALLCKQSSPSERPTMSEIVRILDGDGLAERWIIDDHENIDSELLR